MEKVTVSTADRTSSRAVELPKIFSARPQVDGGQRRASHSGEGGKGGNEHQDGKGDPQPGEGLPAHLLNVPDVNPVHDVIQHVDELGGHGGQGQLHHQRPDGGAGQSLLAPVRLRQANPS